MFTDTLIETETSFKKTCQYCSKKIEPKEEQYYKGRVYHPQCKEAIMLRETDPEVFKDISDIRRATEVLFETSPGWRVSNKLRIKLVRRAVNFLLPAR